MAAVSQQTINWPTRGRDQGHMTHFLNFGLPMERVQTDASSLVCIGPRWIVATGPTKDELPVENLRGRG